MYEDYTIIIINRYYPLAEFCIKSIKDLYPDINILLLLNSIEVNDLRLRYFEKYKNIKIIIKEFKEHPGWKNSGLDWKHGENLDFCAKKVETKYFITCDDDIFIRSDIIETINACFKKENVHSIGNKQEISNKYLPRLDPCFFSINNKTYNEYKMTFKPNDSNNYMFDVGCFILLDHEKYNLKYNNLDIFKYLIHLRGMTYDIFRFRKFNFLELLGEKKEIPEIKIDYFDLSQINKSKINVLNLFCKITQKENVENNFSFKRI